MLVKTLNIPNLFFVNIKSFIGVDVYATLSRKTSLNGERGSTVVKVLQIGRSLVRSQVVSVEFFIDIKSFRSHYGPGVDSASNRNEYQEYFLGVKAAGA